MSREGKTIYRNADRIINTHDILISFYSFHILNIDVNHIKIMYIIMMKINQYDWGINY